MACERSITFNPRNSTSPASRSWPLRTPARSTSLLMCQDNAEFTADLRGLFFHLADQFKLAA